MAPRSRPGASRRSRSGTRAIRALLGGGEPDADFLEATRERARELGVNGWVRDAPPGGLAAHAEGSPAALEELIAFLRTRDAAGGGADVEIQDVPLEGHEQFAIRGVSAGTFVVQQHAASTHHFDLRLEVARVMRSWAVPRGPSLDPSVKRLAVQVPDHGLERNEFEGRTDGGAVLLWDRGPYEQGGRVAWPEALERGHAVFVLHGEKLRGGFALQRTRPGPRPQWLLLKRRDEDARPGSDIVAERPASVLSGQTLEQVLGEGSAAPPRRRGRQ